MRFSEKLAELRRREGLSQEQLADQLGVTRQSVSKWESGTAMPELNKLIALSDFFGVTIDYLVKEQRQEVQQPDDEVVQLEKRLDDLAGKYHASFGAYYSYTSRKKLLGLPLVSIRFGRDRRPSRDNTAVGIIAIGNFSVGIISIGLISVGLISVGMIAFGGLALGMVAMGGVAIATSAIGVVSHGLSAVKLIK